MIRKSDLGFVKVVLDLDLGKVGQYKKMDWDL